MAEEPYTGWESVPTTYNGSQAYEDLVSLQAKWNASSGRLFSSNENHLEILRVLYMGKRMLDVVLLYHKYCS